MQYTFRLQQFSNILISFDFAHIPNLSCPIDVVYNGEIFFVHIFSHFREKEADTWDHF